MAKKINVDSSIYSELVDLQNKVKEFQMYMKLNPIISSVNAASISLPEEDQDKLHKEMLMQIKINYALFDWLPLLEKLKDTEKASKSTYGDVEVGGAFKKK